MCSESTIRVLLLISSCLPSQCNGAFASHQLHHKNAHNGAPCHALSTQALPKYFLMSCRGVSRHASECNFIRASDRNAALPAPIPTKPTSAEQRCVLISHNRVSLRLFEKCRKYRLKFIFAIKHSSTATEPGLAGVTCGA